MKKSELLELLKDIEEDADINETLQGIEGLAKPFDITSIGIEDFKNVLKNNKEIKGYYTSEKDRAVSKGIETFKSNNLQALIDEAVKAKSNEGKTPEQIKLEEMESKYKDLERQMALKESKANYSKVLADKKLNAKLLDYLPYEAGDEEINKVIDIFSNIISAGITEGINSKITENPPIPEAGQGLSNMDGVEQAFFERTGLKL
ncbi:capsid assembly scaffolding protein Gp46 family protein [Clostridium tertium]|uniref:capsid assembly scaffolding protein Gp46 family protein n=1 Tax=Clostridium tertium TaxID=1559 RepID=UPI0018A985C4|nr:DUF4355 domain-containing protein [Clostridium tertium]